MTLVELVETGRALITVEETAEVLGLRRTATYDAVRRRQIPSVRLGRRLFVPVPALMQFLDSKNAAKFDRTGERIVPEVDGDCPRADRHF